VGALRLNDVPPVSLPHGYDNTLLDPAAQEATAILDWEWAHAGDRVEDLAWCE
jgi:aminoglycoside phosphotransferase (APT) family kinase protein